jgi:hypothetical protein
MPLDVTGEDPQGADANGAVPSEALEEGLERFEGTVLAVTHDRWFVRDFDRYLVYGADGSAYESDGPVWDEGRVHRAR